MFRVYDYTNATRLFGEDFTSRPTSGGGNNNPNLSEPEQVISVAGFDVRVTEAGRYIVTDVDGTAALVSFDEYKEQLAARLLQEVSTVDDFRNCWADPQCRAELVNALERAGYAPEVIRTGEVKDEYDLYDVLAELVWGINPRTRQERAEAFDYKNAAWLDALPDDAAATLRAIASQFVGEGATALENLRLFDTPIVRRAGGLPALQQAGAPGELITETKRRLLAA